MNGRLNCLSPRTSWQHDSATSMNDPQDQADRRRAFARFCAYPGRSVRLMTACLLFVVTAGSVFLCHDSPAADRRSDSAADSASRRAQQISWQPVGLSGGGGMFSPAISPADSDLMMINCDMGAAYLSEDGGHNWRMINHAQLRSDTRCRPAFHPTNPDIIFASSRGRLRVSRDRGKTFQEIGNLKESLGGEIAINPLEPGVMLVGTRSGRCFVSLDAGRKWTRCDGPRGDVLGFHFDQTGGHPLMFAATTTGVWRSDDRGHTWVTRTQGLPWAELQGFSGGSDVRGKIAMLYCTVRSKMVDGELIGGIFVSNDRGETWQSVMGTGLNKETRQSDQWGFGSVAQYKQILTTDVEPTTVYVWNTSTGFSPPHSDTVYRSDDSGKTWRATYFEDPRFKRYNVAPNYVTASTGQSWKGGDTPFGVAICTTDPDRVMLVRGQCHITDNGGVTWFNGHTRPAVEHKPGPGCPWQCTGLVVTTTWNYYIDPFQANRHYIAYTDIGFARSLDAGSTWIWWDKKTWAPWRNTCYEIAFDPDVPGKMFGAFSNVHDIPNDNIISERHGHDRPGGVCQSTDFGASWQHVAKGLPPSPVTSIVLDPKRARENRTLYAGVFGRGVYKSTDAGKTWVPKNQGLGAPRNMRVSRVVLHRDGTLFAMICAKRPGVRKPLMPDGVGLYRSTDGGEQWEKMNRYQLFLYPKDFSVHPNDSNVILLGACDSDWNDKSGGLYRTIDGGRTWKRVGRQGRQTFGGYFHPRFAGWIYMTLTEEAQGAGLWLSKDDGQTWRAFEQLPFSNIQRITFDPQNDAQMWVTTFGGSAWRGPVVPRAKESR